MALKNAVSRQAMTWFTKNGTSLQRPKALERHGTARRIAANPAAKCMCCRVACCLASLGKQHTLPIHLRSTVVSALSPSRLASRLLLVFVALPTKYMPVLSVIGQPYRTLASSRSVNSSLRFPSLFLKGPCSCSFQVRKARKDFIFHESTNDSWQCCYCHGGSGAYPNSLLLPASYSIFFRLTPIPPPPSFPFPFCHCPFNFICPWTLTSGDETAVQNVMQPAVSLILLRLTRNFPSEASTTSLVGTSQEQTNLARMYQASFLVFSMAPFLGLDRWSTARSLPGDVLRYLVVSWATSPDQRSHIPALSSATTRLQHFDHAGLPACRPVEALVGDQAFHAMFILGILGILSLNFGGLESGLSGPYWLLSCRVSHQPLAILVYIACCELLFGVYRFLSRQWRYGCHCPLSQYSMPSGHLTRCLT
jgi:hypothetical protein